MKSANKESAHWDGSKYNKNSQLQYDASVKLLQNYDFKGDEEVLDVGCGDGKISRYIAEKVPRGHVLAVDYSQSMLDTAQREPLPSNLRFEFRNAQSLGFNKQFDVVFSTFCLQWVPDKLKAFQEIHKSLKEDSQAIIIMPLRHQEIAKIRKQMTETTWRNYFSDYVDPSDVLEDSDYQKYAREAGLEIRWFEEEPVTTKFKNMQELTGFLSIVTPNVSKLPDERTKSAFMDELVENYLHNHPANKDGSCEVTYTYVKLSAKRPALEEAYIMPPPSGKDAPKNNHF